MKLSEFVKKKLQPRGRLARSRSSARRTRSKINIHTARPGIVIGKRGAGVETAQEGAPEAHRERGLPQHPGGPQGRDQRAARRREHRDPARAPRRLPPRHEEGGADRDEVRRQGHPRRVLAAASAAPRWRATSGTARAACRCTRCAPTSTTASPRRKTTYGTIGVKCWIFKGEVLPQRAGQRRRRSQRRGAERMSMLSPKRIKFRKMQKGRMPRHRASAASTSRFGDFGLQAARAGLDHRRARSRRRVSRSPATSSAAASSGSAIFPDKPITKKPAETRMGNGKGDAGGVGRRGEARPRDVRDRGRRRDAGARGVPPGRAQAAGPDARSCAREVLL